MHSSSVNQETRDSMVLFVSSAIVTVFSLGDFRVLHQNPSSMRYYGNITSHVDHDGIPEQEPDAVSGPDVLHHIFSLDACKLKRMLDDVTKRGGVGRCWKGVIRMPPPGSLRLAAVQADEKTKLEVVETLQVPAVEDVLQQGDDLGSSRIRLPLSGDENQGDDGDVAENCLLAPPLSQLHQQLQPETSEPGRSPKPEPSVRPEVLMPDQCNARSAADSTGIFCKLDNNNCMQQRDILQAGGLTALQHGEALSAPQPSNLPSTPEVGRQQWPQESQHRDAGSWPAKPGEGLLTGQPGHDGLEPRDKAAVTLGLCKLRCTASVIGHGSGSGGGHDQRRRQSLTSLKALVLHPHRGGFSGISGLNARERSVSGPGASGRALPISTATALDFGSGGSGRGRSSSSNKLQRHVGTATIATATASVSAWTPSFPLSRSITMAHASGSIGGIENGGGGGSYGSGLEGRFSRLSRHKGVSKDLASPLTTNPREGAIIPIIGALRKGKRINSPRAFHFLMPLGNSAPGNADGSADGIAVAAASGAPNTITETRMDVNEEMDDLGGPCSMATRPNFKFMVPIALDGHSGSMVSGQGCQTPSLLFQPRMDGALLRRGLSGNMSLSLSGAQLLLDTTAVQGRALPSHLCRRLVPGLMQPVSQLLQHNDPLATSTLSLSLGPLQMPLMASLPSMGITSCSGLSFQPAQGRGPGLGSRGADTHTNYPITTTSNAVFGTGLCSSSACVNISAATHQRVQTSQPAAPQPLNASGRSSATSHTLAKAAQLRGGVTAGSHRGGGGLGDSTSRLLLETTAGFATATTNTTNTTTAAGALTCPGNSTSLLSSLSTNLDRMMMANRLCETPPPLQPLRIRPPAPVVPQPARIQARIKTFSSCDQGYLFSPAVAGAQAAFQQPTLMPPPSGDEEQVGVQEHQQHQEQQQRMSSSLGRVQACQFRVQPQTQQQECVRYYLRKEIGSRKVSDEERHQVKQERTAPVSAAPPMGQLALFGPLLNAPSTLEATTRERGEGGARPGGRLEDAKGIRCGSFPHLPVNSGLQEPGAVVSQLQSGDWRKGGACHYKPNLITAPSSSPSDATDLRLSAIPSGGSRASGSDNQNVDLAAVKPTDVLLPAVHGNAHEGLTPGPGEGAGLASVTSTPIPGFDAGPAGCMTQLVMDGTGERTTGTTKRDTNGSGDASGGGGGTTATASAAAEAWCRKSTFERDTSGGGAAGGTGGGVMGLLSGLGSVDVEPAYGRELCSGFFTVDGAQRDGTQDQEPFLERISEAASLARELGTASLGLSFGAPASQIRGLGTLRSTATAATPSLDSRRGMTSAEAAATRTSLDRHRGQTRSGGMAPRPSRDNRRGLTCNGVMASRPSLDSRRGLSSAGAISLRRSLDIRRGLLEKGAIAATANGKANVEPIAVTTGPEGLSRSQLGRGNAGASVADGDGGGEGTCFEASELLSSPGAASATAIVEPIEEHWHEVWATRAVDPVTGEDVVILAQHDVTAKVVAERQVALVMETEHRLLEQLFPRHILQHITEEWTRKVAALAAMPGKHLGPGGGVGGGAGGASGGCRKSARNCLPGSFRLQPLAMDCSSLATWHEQVTLLFADIKGFTPMCKELQPFQVMRMLNDLFSRWDTLLGTYGVHKVETIGDCYFVAGGLFCYDADGMVVVRDRCSGNRQPDPHHARRVFEFAKAMLVEASAVPLPTNGEPVQVRVGIHSGPVVSGVVGTRMPRFCLFGDTVNTASRMESTGVPGGIHISDTTRQLLMADEEAEDCAAAAAAAVDVGGGMGCWTATGGIQVKGKGLMQTWLWSPAS
ncbi:hypothetical protein Vretimale_18640 [Volvox reticuliferus]|uniref:Guanylate cyclase domain-containing protein n=2 Tax=Volvox reticuliferus TaxID=1737510 RepID=A0A8J4GYD7_9CHLO|nr:hypothetical protein Vretimale_18640 [Volvox reticuliferus]